MGDFYDAMNQTAFAADRRHKIKGRTAAEMASIEDESLDWIHLHQTTHSKEEDVLLKDIQGWYPKLRPGGLMSGDDYGDTRYPPLMLARRWVHWLSVDRRKESNRWGVVELFERLARQLSVELHVTWLNDCYQFNSWYFVKPEIINQAESRLSN